MNAYFYITNNLGNKNNALRTLNPFVKKGFMRKHLKFNLVGSKKINCDFLRIFISTRLKQKRDGYTSSS